MSGRAPTWDIILHDLRRGLKKMVEPYSGRIECRNSHLGYPTLTLIVYYGETEVRREVTVEYEYDRDIKVLREEIVDKIIPAIREAVIELMDPDGGLKSISVKEIYAKGEEQDEKGSEV